MKEAPMSRPEIVRETRYFSEEGRSNMAACIDYALEFAEKEQISSAVIFTATGEGPVYAVQKLIDPSYSEVKLIAVTPPMGKLYRENPSNPDSAVFRVGILNQSRRTILESSGVSIISAHLPFKGILVGTQSVSEWSKVSETLEIFGGGLSLCIQSVLLACDSGEIEPGQRVVAISADTAISVLASRTEAFLAARNGLLLEHIICRPLRYDITKKDHRYLNVMWEHAQKKE